MADGGLDSLTMRTLARRLGVAPNALYSHVASKAELVDDLRDDVLAGVEKPPVDIEDPVAGLHRLLASTYEVSPPTESWYRSTLLARVPVDRTLDGWERR